MIPRRSASTPRLPRPARALLVALAAAGMVAADDRTEPIDIIIALDKSLSMEEEIEAVKAYVDEFIVRELLIVGTTSIWCCSTATPTWRCRKRSSPKMCVRR